MSDAAAPYLRWVPTSATAWSICSSRSTGCAPPTASASMHCRTCTRPRRSAGPSRVAYLNAVVAVDTDLDPWPLLALAHALEQEAHRVRAERWGPRTLDVDVLWIDGVALDDPDLTVPHPRMWERAFVLMPLADVAPALVAGQLVERGGVETAGADGVTRTVNALR